MNREEYKRANFMSEDQKRAMGKLPRTHDNCREKTGVSRPGKTAQERARRSQRD